MSGIWLVHSFLVCSLLSRESQGAPPTLLRISLCVITLVSPQPIGHHRPMSPPRSSNARSRERAPDRILLLLNELEPLQDAIEFGTSKRRVGDVDDLDLALRIDDEQARLGKRPVGFLWRSRLGDVEAQRAPLRSRPIPPHSQAPPFFPPFL